ncbi:receptor-type tyrosine-protein phosphatase T-like [Mercenaria mercenaria]|uniref:receptor-type tyrosine-protein phosphatase T-like n=1 Tax=Mercenaria mercenaria TaxID=6596 RepID=UPI00234EFE28|nr:receptor-type tyrosine-protein phosphatase T-like [Mercenaria mercenaria]
MHNVLVEKHEQLRYRFSVPYVAQVSPNEIFSNRGCREYRLRNFLIFGYNKALCRKADEYWCEIYDDRGLDVYKNDVIRIKVDTNLTYSKIAVNVPKQRTVQDKEFTYLTLCEVKIFADACEYKRIINGYMNPNKTVFAVNEKATIVCIDGFQPDIQEITCMNNRYWDGNAQCSQVTCEHPGNPKNGLYIIGKILEGNIFASFSSLPFESVITVKCDNGYDSKGNEVRHCQSNRDWSGIQPVCRKKQCPHPGNISNGVFKFKNESVYSLGPSFYNTTIFVECIKGYNLNGSKQLTCGADETWGENPFCNIVTCDFPENPKNGSYVTKDHNGKITPYTKLSGHSNYNDIIYIACYEGHRFNSTSKIRKCLETKEWSGESGGCVLVTCKKLEQLEGGFFNYTNTALSDRFPYNTVVTVHCYQQFKLSNAQNRTRRCTEEGYWDSEPALCILTDTDTDTNVVERSNAAIIGGASASAIVLICVALVIFFLYHRRKKHDNKGDKPRRYANFVRKNNASNELADIREGEYAEIQEASYSSPADNTTSHVSIKSGSQSADTMYSTAYSLSEHEEHMKPSMASSASLQSRQAYYSFTNLNKVPKSAIPVKDLPDLVLTGDVAKLKFEKEFQNLPQGMVEEHNEARKKQNITKNRYRNLYAYDDTRVVLATDDKSQSDYINACYVHGFKKAKEYIASQGPTKEILTDFWRMIWQTECSKVVMLTNVIEEGKTKCEQYWPEEGSSSTFGSVTVFTENTESFSQFVIRKLKIRNETSKEKSKTITQFHFTAWPDRGVPKYASSLVHFLNKVKYAPVHGKGPIVVHCSAGVGRTGTFIALDYLTEQGKAMGFVDVVGTLTSMRRQRVSLVQTLEQYIFVHHALVESLMLSPSALSAQVFPEAYQELLLMDPEKKQRKIFVEFETLKRVSPVADENEYVTSKLVRNRRKNRYSNVLPVEEFMPSLMSNSDNGESRYINAVFLPSYKNRKAFIITQTPLESTKEDFWGLVWEHDVHTIVMMNDITETTESERYWPENDETAAFANIEITNNGNEEINHHQVVSLSVKKYKVKRKVKQIRCGRWPQKNNLPDSPEVILNLMELVQASQQQSQNHTVLVHCMNGADKSGLYCVISAVIERLKIEQDVAIAQVIEEMRNAREQIIPSVDQYQFCHEAVLAFIHQYDTYSNFSM